MMVQCPSGEWQKKAQPTRQKRRESRWALEDASPVRIPIIGKADVPLETVCALLNIPPAAPEPSLTIFPSPISKPYTSDSDSPHILGLLKEVLAAFLSSVISQ